MQGTFVLTLKTDSKYGFYSQKASTIKIKAVLRFLVSPNSSESQSNFDSSSPKSPQNVWTRKPTASQRRQSQSQSTGSSGSDSKDAGIRDANVPSRNEPPKRPVPIIGRSETMDSSRSRNSPQNSIVQRQTSLSSMNKPPDFVETKYPVVNLGFNFSQSNFKLTVDVNEAKNLSNVFRVIPSCYVTIELVSSSTNQEIPQRTEVVAKSFNPRWNKTIAFNTSSELLHNSVLSVTQPLRASTTRTPFFHSILPIPKLPVTAVTCRTFFPVRLRNAVPATATVPEFVPAPRRPIT